MNKQVPFIGNTPDDMHCVPAVFRMLYKYSLDKDLTWEKVDEILKSVPGKGTWTMTGLTDLAKSGINVINIEPIDYDALYAKGADYLKGIIGAETAKYYLENSNIKSVIPYIPDFIKNVKQEVRRSSLEEVQKFLLEDSLVGVEVNSCIVNNKSGFSLHYVLLYAIDGENVILHDPGLPPLESRKVSFDDFEKAFNFEGANAGITVFKI